jgi:hypothetical protein
MFAPLLERLAIALGSARIPYMIVGGQAVLVYGEPRLTKDIDVTLGFDVDRLPDILGISRDLSLSPLVDPEEFTKKTRVLPCQDSSTGIRVDFIFSFSPYEQEALGRARAVRVGATAVRFASPEDVIIHKVIAGRPRDLEDAKSILLKNAGLDEGYMKRWLGSFEKSLGEPFLARYEALRDSAK